MRRMGWPLVVLLLAASCTSIGTAKREVPRPFKQSAEDEHKVDYLLGRWQQWNSNIKTFDCRFKRWTYDSIFGRPDKPKHIDLGVIKYTAAGQSFFRIDTTEEDGKQRPIEAGRAEHWVYDGQSLMEYNYQKETLIEHRLPREFQGAKLLDGPLVFAPLAAIGGLAGSPAASSYPFGGDVKKLKELYYFREVASKDTPPNLIRLEAYPHNAAIAATMHHLQMIFQASDMSPVALKIVQPNGNDYVVYQLYDIVVNGPQPPSRISPFHPAKPFGWEKTVK
jgi:hypothetical protein